ncbi:MAG: PIG-L family deacetylase [Victivallaceae bacterium]|nr:PIG-L family deacetylase [Victivallaceae bacterium]
MARRYLMIGAHPDDADICFGGTAIKLAKAGHTVKFVSFCNGDCGHFSMDCAALAARRQKETQQAKQVLGIAEYEVLAQNHDCELVPSLENRREVIRLIRGFKPDVVLTHRLCDYHADHRAVSQLVLDASYMVQVPLFCPDFPILEKAPVFAYVYDDFTDPRPCRADAVVAIDDAMEQKCRALDCQKSQFYEWLAYELGYYGKVDFDAMPWEKRYEYLLAHWGRRYRASAEVARAKLCEKYGETAGSKVVYAELFEYCPYGGRKNLTAAEFAALFNV